MAAGDPFCPVHGFAPCFCKFPQWPSLTSGSWTPPAPFQSMDLEKDALRAEVEQLRAEVRRLSLEALERAGAPELTEFLRMPPGALEPIHAVKDCPCGCDDETPVPCRECGTLCLDGLCHACTVRKHTSPRREVDTGALYTPAIYPVPPGAIETFETPPLTCSGCAARVYKVTAQDGGLYCDICYPQDWQAEVPTVPAFAPPCVCGASSTGEPHAHYCPRRA